MVTKKTFLGKACFEHISAKWQLPPGRQVAAADQQLAGTRRSRLNEFEREKKPVEVCCPFLSGLLGSFSNLVTSRLPSRQ